MSHKTIEELIKIMNICPHFSVPQQVNAHSASAQFNSSRHAFLPLLYVRTRKSITQHILGHGYCSATFLFSLSSILYYSHIIILCIKKIYCLDITPYYHYSTYGPSENPILSFILMAHLTDGTGQISPECTIAIQTCARILSYFLFFAPSFQN